MMTYGFFKCYSEQILLMLILEHSFLSVNHPLSAMCIMANKKGCLVQTAFLS
jgi:hypothetical protein